MAVKKLHPHIVAKASAAELQDFKQEAAMLKDVGHPYILTFYEAMLDRPPYMLLSEVRKASVAVIAAVQHAHIDVLMQA